MTDAPKLALVKNDSVSSSDEREPPEAQGAIAQRLSQVQKAAVIVALMGEKEARPITANFSAKELEAMESAYESITCLKKGELAEIAVDFIRTLRSMNGALKGGDRAAEIIKMVVDPEHLENLTNKGSSKKVVVNEGGVWERLNEISPKRIGTYLSGLSPQIAALILSKLSSTLAAKVLETMDIAVAQYIVADILNTGPMSYELETALMRMIENDVLSVDDSIDDDDEDSESFDNIGELLSLISSEKRQQISTFLSEHDEGAFSSIKKRMLTIETLPKILPRNGVPIVFRAMNEEQTVQAIMVLQKRAPKTAEYFLTNISKRLAEQLQSVVKKAEMPDDSAQEDIEIALLSIIMDLARSGEITLSNKD